MNKSKRNITCIVILVFFIIGCSTSYNKNVTSSNQISSNKENGVSDKVSSNKRAIVKRSVLFESKKWIETVPPVYDSEEWYKANYSREEWKVEYSNGIKITKYNHNNYKNYIKLSINEGYLLGRDNGEFGGDLTFYPLGDKNKKYKVMDGNIIGFYKVNNEIYVVERLSHMLMSKGTISKLKMINNKWVAIKIIDIEAPYTFTLENNELYLVTDYRVLKIVNEKIAEVIINDGFWSGLYPTSVVYANDYIFIGMRKGVAKVNIKTKKMSWLVRS